MLALFSLALMQVATNTPVPVVSDAPPSLLLAAYDQCLGREIDARLIDPISAEEVFDESHSQCDYLLNAYVTKVTSAIVATNTDYQREKVRLVENLKAAVVPRIADRRASSLQPTDEIPPGSRTTEKSN